MTVTEYLVARLRELRVNHLFGVPGDYNLSLLERVLHSDGISFVGCCNELNASYAADGYARITGMAALVTTYGVGELSALAGVAGAYAEKIPIICINGAPPLRMIESGALVHHTMADGNYTNMLHCYQNFTVAQGVLTPLNARQEIDRVLLACASQSRPVYLQVPSDVAEAEIGPNPPLFEFRKEEHSAVCIEAARAIEHELCLAKKPAILVDADVDRFRLLAPVLSLAEKRGLPIAYLIPAKGLLPESHPNVLGIYRGAASSPEVLKAVEEADCLLCIGTRFTDVATGLFSHKLNLQNQIEIQSTSVAMNGALFENVRALSVLNQVAASVPVTNHSLVLQGEANVSGDQTSAEGDILTQDSLWRTIQSFLRPGDIVVSDTGTAFFASSKLKFKPEMSFVGQPIWAALGYGIPACLGACLAAPERRVLLFVGDGGLQMSVQELSSLLRFGLTPIIILLNNDGYTIERLIHGPESIYNDIQPWNYPLLTRVFGAAEQSTVKTVRTSNELKQTLESVNAQAKLSFVEAILSRMDASASLVGFLKHVAKVNFTSE